MKEYTPREYSEREKNEIRANVWADVVSRDENKVWARDKLIEYEGEKSAAQRVNKMEEE